MTRPIEDLADELWTLVGAATPPGPIEVSGARSVLPSEFDVTGFAAASIGVATAAVAALVAARADGALPVARVDTRRSAAAFVGELLFTPVGWARAAVWDPVAGDYPAADGWIRLHTNAAAHRAAALAVLGLPDEEATDRRSVAAIVAGLPADELEASVVERGGAAAAMHDEASWRALPHGTASAGEPPVRVRRPAGPQADPRWTSVAPTRPLAGVRVLDLTRVIAGPVCTRVLAAYGAEVLRLDPPRYEEVAAILPVVTPGKRCAALDLADPDGRSRFAALVASADVVVHGLRPGALEDLGFGAAELRALNPGLVEARLDAYGWTGPWARRRGFDSLVQMSCGIAAAGQAATGAPGPVPLPAQALDHGTGYLLAAAVVRALEARLTAGVPAEISASLLGAANLLRSLPTPGDITGPRPDWGPADLVDVTTAWGPARAVAPAGEVDGHPARYDAPAGPLGRDAAAW